MRARATDGRSGMFPMRWKRTRPCIARVGGCLACTQRCDPSRKREHLALDYTGRSLPARVIPDMTSLQKCTAETLGAQRTPKTKHDGCMAKAKRMCA